ncbi:hypothetical protein RHMOL_Rhmol06G0278400 [Rhododendron molle]|uniref:Uncharacterized protein n=1 Tax=Rhododendron molle TaxID=49168 RepID=A0ACC0NI45_RHOML|nr:hypothetical protein RHMOL_Rhmol06G0278400 [Rhododendron molle]
MVSELWVFEENEEDENSYQVLRKAVKEYWTTMKEYYKALVNKGGIMHIATKAELGDGMDIFSRRRPGKQMRNLQKSFLKPAIDYLKIIVGANAEDSKEWARKRRVMKVLEKESIKWSEERNGRTIVVCWALGYVVAALFFAVVEMSIDTIILSFCQDSDEHQGTAQYAPPLLIETLNDQNEMQRLTQ